MENQKEKRAELPKVSLRKAGALFIGTTFLVLLIALCICISSRSHIQRQYTQAREQIGQTVYTELYMLCQTFDQVTVPGADVEDGIIPDMKSHYFAAQTVNQVLSESFGAKYAPLSAEHVAALDGAFAAYDAAFSTGKSTDEAQTTMQVCIDMIRTLLNEKFYDGSLRMD